MKKIAWLLILSVAFVACNNDDDGTPQNVNATLNFNVNWDGEEITNSDFENTQYTNANGEELTMTRLRFMISNVTFTDANGNAFSAGAYNLTDVRQQVGMSYQPDVVFPAGTYTVSFRFGFNDEDNVDGAYADLTSAEWGVPMMLGGGYHYMQLDGTYINTDGDVAPYNYHAIRAADPTVTPLLLTDTSFEVVLGQYNIELSNGVIEVDMNVAEWFKNPNTWDLNELDTPLMPNYNAQIMMNENGSNGVFSAMD